MGLKLERDAVSVLLITAGWLASFVVVLLPSDIYDPSLILWAIVRGIVGLITGLVLRRTDPRSPWKQVPVVTIGWAVGVGIGLGLLYFGLFESWLLVGAIAGLVGGLITALALKWTHPSIQWKHVTLVTLGWGIGWAVGGATGWAVGEALGWESDFIYLLAFALWGGIGGAVGSWVMFGQIRRARQTPP